MATDRTLNRMVGFETTMVTNVPEQTFRVQSDQQALSTTATSKVDRTFRDEKQEPGSRINSGFFNLKGVRYRNEKCLSDT